MEKEYKGLMLTLDDDGGVSWESLCDVDSCYASSHKGAVLLKDGPYVFCETHYRQLQQPDVEPVVEPAVVRAWLPDDESWWMTLVEDAIRVNVDAAKAITMANMILEARRKLFGTSRPSCTR